ncbi:hypothetical protein E2C01_036979 [Portunus trituberculatus]|uniref:Uncharacterized protein n=1 Tax=Portunus trituberculatus TaxID=210409 RepID=A0A5B7FCW2_PORTR|nr:hypothetical protein [Portunus trituberculatus]
MTRTTLSRRLTFHLKNGEIKQHFTTKHKTKVTRSILEENTGIIDTEKDPHNLLYLEELYIGNTSLTNKQTATRSASPPYNQKNQPHPHQDSPYLTAQPMKVWLHPRCLSSNDNTTDQHKPPVQSLSRIHIRQTAHLCPHSA